MKAENPFRDWLGADIYGGTWIPVAGLGGWLGPASLPVLFPTGNEDRLLADPDWPMQFDDARPEVWEDADGNKESHLHPQHQLGELPLEPLAAYYRPPGRRSWLEPVQGFVLYHEAAPRHDAQGGISWEGARRRWAARRDRPLAPRRR